jgi:hypothetical protein
MATTGGANIAVDGLVFGYDTGYPLVSGSSDAYKFNRGEPTENLIANTNLINVVDGTFTTNTTVDGVRILENNQVNNSHVMWNSATGFIVTCSAGAYITVSAEYKTDCTIRMRFRDNPYDAQYDIDGGNIATISEQGVDFNTNGEWKRYSLTAQTATTNPDLWWYLVDYRTNNEFGRVEIRNWQIEVKSHATPFTTGTRSVSGSLIDLTRTTDIDLSNVSFDSNAQMTFDGTDDRATVADPGYPSSGTDPFTLEIIYKVPTGATWYINGSGTALIGRGSYQGSIGIFRASTEGNVKFWIRLDGGNIYDPGVTGLSRDDYHHIVGTFDGVDTAKIYHNGVFIAQEVNANNAGTFDAGGFNVGGGISFGGNFGGYGEGEVPVSKLYNRALTASEIKSNFNAIKGRFNIL